MKKNYPFLCILLITVMLFGCSQVKQNDTQMFSPPNFLIILVDDLGFSDLGCYGSEIKTPNLDQLAGQGIIFSDLYVSSLCAPSRAMLLTGVDNHQNGFGTMPPGHTENQYLKPGYEGVLNDRAITIPEVLRNNGYHTYMTGKWHLGHHEANYPMNKGFEKSFAFMGGGSGHFSNAFALGPGEEPVSFYVRDKQIIEKLPKDFYSTRNFTNEMISYILNQEDDSPFFAYLAYTAPHDPLHVPDSYLEKYTNVYDAGYEQIKKDRLIRMKELGIIEESVPFNPGTGKFPSWQDLNEQEKELQARKMEIYASMVENLDFHIGRLIDSMKLAGIYENTFIFFLSDNGANPKEAVFYPGNSQEYLDANFDNSLGNLGKSNSFVSQGGAWAEVSNTPFTYFKTTTGEGGIHAPLIISGPGIRSQISNGKTGIHVCDIFPTILEFAGLSRPDVYNENELAPLYGKSAMQFLIGKEEMVRNTQNDPLHFEMAECKAIIKGNWKAIMLQPPYVDNAEWQLFDLSTDPLEKHNRAFSEPGILDELVHEWNEYAKSVGYIEAEGEMLIYEIGPEEFYKYEGLLE